jgi:hypothetical protein
MYMKNRDGNKHTETNVLISLRMVLTALCPRAGQPARTATQAVADTAPEASPVVGALRRRQLRFACCRRCLEMAAMQTMLFEAMLE